jgi:hypothetical protein
MAFNPRELEQFLSAVVKAEHNILITGAPGIGKTDIVRQVAASIGFDLLLSHPAVEDPTTVAGLPWFEKGAKHATFKPFGNMARAMESTRPLLWFLDDLGQATPAVQAAYMQLLLAGEVNGHKLPAHVVMVAATNRRTDRAGVSGILEPVKSRFVSIVELEADLASWCEWAIDHDIPPVLIAFLRFRPELLSAFVPSADLTNSPMPRTWAHLAKLEALNLPAGIEVKAMAGAVGEGAAGEYLAFRSMYRSIVNVDAILLNPQAAALPTKPDQLYAVSVALASRATAQNLKGIGIYAQRMVDAERGEFAVLTLRDAVRRDEALQYTDAFVRITAGPLGQLLNGSTK